MRLPFFRAKPATAPPAAERKRASPKAETARLVDDDAVAAARTRARRRLVGALVLLAIGVVGFPVLFETQPRPLPLDTPIRAPVRAPGALGDAQPRDAAPPLVMPAPALARPAITPPADAGQETAAAPAPAHVPESRVATVMPSAAGPASAAALPSATAKPSAVASNKPAAAQPAPARPSPPPTASAAAPTSARFIVQVGAYTDPATLREARAKVEKLGLKTYTQVIEGDSGKRTRVRLGPYATREEADAAAAKLKRAGLPANILAL